MEIGFGYQARAPYSTDPKSSHGRLYPTVESPTRTCYQRDRDRIIHSSAFRRLQYKTQVFTYHEGDHFRTRLTHTLEVAQISRSIARALRLDEDLSEALALAHDLGHPPFAHAGERALQRVMSNFGGFDHNAQSLRVVTQLEKRYPDFDGLNLSWEVLEGIAKHNGPLLKDRPTHELENDADELKDGTSGSEYDALRSEYDALPFAIQAFNKIYDLSLADYPSLEAQVAALADDIAYNSHDIDDGCRAGLISLDDLRQLEFCNRILDQLESDFPNIIEGRRIHEFTRRMITELVEDVIGNTQSALEAHNISDQSDVAGAGCRLVQFSPEVQAFDKALKAFMFEHVYWHESVIRVMGQAETMIERLFSHYMDHPGDLEESWAQIAANRDGHSLARTVTDYIAGMTDRYIVQEYERIFDEDKLTKLIR